MNESSEDEEMREWVRKNMAADPTNVLREYRERAAKFIGVAGDGSVVVKAGEKWGARDRIAAYLLGKQYAVAGGLATDPVVANQELVVSLGIPDNTVAPRVKELRDSRLVTAVENGRHVLPLSSVRRVIEDLEEL